jgi:hypothetical protein
MDRCVLRSAWRKWTRVYGRLRGAGYRRDMDTTARAFDLPADLDSGGSAPRYGAPCSVVPHGGKPLSLAELGGARAGWHGSQTLKNLLHAYLEPAEYDAVLYELAASSLARERSAATGAGLAALGGAALAGLALVRSRRR